jgi:hypothetical protein
MDIPTGGFPPIIVCQKQKQNDIKYRKLNPIVSSIPISSIFSSIKKNK